MDLQPTLAAQGYRASRPATEPGASDAPETALGRAAADFHETLRTSEAAALDAMTGDADPHALVQALAQTEIALETAVAVRDKVVAAYQEILRMPV